MELQNLNIQNFTYFDWFITLILAFIVCHYVVITFILSNRNSKIEELKEKLERQEGLSGLHKGNADKNYSRYSDEKGVTNRLRAQLLVKEDVIKNLREKLAKLEGAKPTIAAKEGSKEMSGKIGSKSPSPHKRPYRGNKPNDQQGS